MKLKKIGALLLTCAVTASVLSLPALAVEEDTQKPKTLQESAQLAAETAMAYGGSTSIQYALWDNGEITLSGHAGVYSKTENTALTEHTLYGIGSVSKVYTTAAVMKLADEGKLKLDDPVTKHLSNFKMADERYKQITIRMLLNHSAGLMGSTLGSVQLFNDPSNLATVSLLSQLATQRLQADPGAYSVYCNDGFTLAELVVEAVSGLDFTTYIHKNLLTPAGLKNTFTPADTFDRALLSKTYSPLSADLVLPTESLGIYGAGGLYASAEDVASFGGLFCGGDMLTQNSLDAMAYPEYTRGFWPTDSDDNGVAYGLGWDSVSMYPFRQSGIQALVKGGDTALYHAGLIVLPEENLAVAVLSSGGMSTYNQLAGARILMDVLAEEGVIVDESTPALPESTPATPPKSELEKAGLYASSTTGVMEVSITEAGEMTLHAVTLAGTPDQKFTYYQDGTYRDKNNSLYVKLVTEENGNTYFFQSVYAPVPQLTTTATVGYFLQKLKDNPLTEEVQSAWDDRTPRSYLPINERYSSMVYALALPLISATLDTPGYYSVNQITSVDTAQAVLQIPGVGSRDQGDITFFEKDGLEYISLVGLLYVDSVVAKNLYVGNGAYCTILDEGHTRWFRTGSLAGKNITVTVPQGGAVYVYDGESTMIASSWISGTDTLSVTLPEDGYLAFVGSAGLRFQLNLA